MRIAPNEEQSAENNNKPLTLTFRLKKINLSPNIGVSKKTNNPANIYVYAAISKLFNLPTSTFLPTIETAPAKRDIVMNNSPIPNCEMIGIKDLVETTKTPYIDIKMKLSNRISNLVL